MSDDVLSGSRELFVLRTELPGPGCWLPAETAVCLLASPSLSPALAVLSCSPGLLCAESCVCLGSVPRVAVPRMAGDVALLC